MNRGAEKLRDRLRQWGEKKKFADWLTSRQPAGSAKVDPPLVSHWFRGDRKPNTFQRALIEDEYGIGWRTWDETVVPKKDVA